MSALHATDKIQRDIEDALKLNDFYYERRTNYYKNQGITPDKILTPLYLASGYVNFILKNPVQATNIKAKFMRNEESYNKVFSNKIDLQVWHKIVEILKQTDKFLETKRPGASGSSEYFLKGRRQLLSFFTVSHILESYNFSVNDLIQFDTSKLKNEEFEKTWNLLIQEVPMQFSRKKTNHKVFFTLCDMFSKEYNISGLQRLLKTIPYKEPSQKIINDNSQIQRKEISKDFIDEVEKLLPKQPWKPGTHKEISLKLNCKEKLIYAATNRLIAQGKIFKQKNGILYDKDDNIVAIDEDRVDLTTMQLKE